MTTTATTGAARRHRTRPPAGTRSLQRAELLLRRAQLRPDPQVGWDRTVAVLAKLLDRHDPFASEHGRLLVAALSVHPHTERRAGPCHSAEQAVRQLLTHGQAPTPKAVADLLQRQQRWEQARARKAGRLTPTADRDGPPGSPVRRRPLARPRPEAVPDPARPGARLAVP